MCSSWILFVTDSILCLVDSWALVIQLNLVFASDVLAFSVLGNNGFPYEILRKRSFTWHCSFLWCLQLSPCILDDVFVLFFVTRNIRINSSQISVRVSVSRLPILVFFSSLSGFSNSCPSVRYVIWTWCRLGFLSVSSQTTRILLEAFRSRMWISCNQSTNPTDFGFRRRSDGHQFVFSCATSKSVWVDLMTSMHFSEWLPPFTGGLTRGSSSSTAPADVVMPPRAIPTSAHLPAKPYFKQITRKAQKSHSCSKKTRIAKHADARKLQRHCAK